MSSPLFFKLVFYSLKIDNITSISSPSASFSVSQSKSVSTLRFFPFITSIIAASASSYNFGLSNGGSLTGNIYSISAYSKKGDVSYLSLAVIYYDSVSAGFSFNTILIPFSLSKDSQYVSLNSEFSPIVYKLFGMQSFSMNTGSLHFGFAFDYSSNIANFTSSEALLEGQGAFWVIGKNPSSVCSNCSGQYITIGGCLTTCGSEWYGYSFASGGKTCRSCSLLLNQQINPVNNSCQCLLGYASINGNCISSPSSTVALSSTTLTPQVLSSNASPLKCNDPNSFPDSTGTVCVCKSGY